MAKKLRKKSRKSAPSRTTGPRGAPATGPVTLKQAEALARAKVPARKGKAAAPPTPAAVGAERTRLEREQREEDRRRIQEYAATFAVMKARGVKGLGPAPKGARAAKAGHQPLRAFAEGDSWFEYPVPLFGGGIIPRLATRLGLPILNLAKAGDEVRSMLGVKERKVLIEQLERGCPAGGRWDALLFSGGGNDIVGDPLALWIRDFDPNVPPAGHIHQPRLDAALALVRAGYEDLIGLRDELSPSTHLVFHGYDFAIPDGRGICHLGPWLKPAFDLRGFEKRGKAHAVVKVLLRQFAALLEQLAAAHDGITVIGTQGTLPEEKSAWHNELHPSRDNFDRFARIFRAKLRELFPTKVP